MATAAQSKFAAGIVAGQTKIEAYTAAHPNDKSTRKARKANATRASQQPAVIAEIARLQKELWARPLILESCPHIDNPHALRAHAIATLVRLTGHHDPQVALLAARDIRDYADKLETARSTILTPAGEKTLAGDLLALYQRAVKSNPLIEAVSEPADTPEPSE